MRLVFLTLLIAASLPVTASAQRFHLAPWRGLVAPNSEPTVQYLAPSEKNVNRSMSGSNESSWQSVSTTRDSHQKPKRQVRHDGPTSVRIAAQRSRELILAREKEFRRSIEDLFSQLDTAINAIHPDDFDGERMTISTLKKIVPELKLQAAITAKKHRTYQASAHNYQEALQAARPDVLRASKLFRKFAAEESYLDLRQQYLQFAASFEAIAVKYQLTATRLSPAVQNVSGNLRYVDRTALFLYRLDAFLVVLPDDDLDAEEFVRQLDRYVRNFERLRMALNAFHQATVIEAATEPEKSSTGKNKVRTKAAPQPEEKQPPARPNDRSLPTTGRLAKRR